MKTFIIYTAARLGLFLLTFGLVWLIGRPFLDSVDATVWWSALLALLISSVASIFLLRRLRESLAAQVEGRAQRMSRRYEEARTREDRDE
ncbi:hypothetical protein BH18ACT8_BH18ACT8_08170 [soil metagenome]